MSYNNEDFQDDVMTILKEKWKELDETEEPNVSTNTEESIDGIVPKELDANKIRNSVEYMSEFIYILTIYFGREDIDPSPYLSTCKYILRDFDTFREMRDFLFELYQPYPTLEWENKEQERKLLAEIVEIIRSYTADYIENYTRDAQLSVHEVPYSVMEKVFELTMFIMMEIEVYFISFFDNPSE